jgi:hypothetical protein
VIASASFLIAVRGAWLWSSFVAPVIARGFGVPMVPGWRLSRRNQHLSEPDYVMGLRGIRRRHRTVRVPYAQTVPLLHNSVHQVPESGRIIPRFEAGYLRSCGIAFRDLHRATSRAAGPPSPIVCVTS